MRKYGVWLDVQQPPQVVTLIPAVPVEQQKLQEPPLMACLYVMFLVLQFDYLFQLLVIYAGSAGQGSEHGQFNL